MNLCQTESIAVTPAIEKINKKQLQSRGPGFANMTGAHSDTLRSISSDILNCAPYATSDDSPDLFAVYELLTAAKNKLDVITGRNQSSDTVKS